MTECLMHSGLAAATNRGNAGLNSGRWPYDLVDVLQLRCRQVWPSQFVIAPSDVPTVIEPLREAELVQLLTATPSDAVQPWICLECRMANEPGRRWCRVCSNHNGVGE